jgi:hypothetical protein
MRLEADLPTAVLLLLAACSTGGSDSSTGRHPPPPPTGLAVAPDDGALRVTWSAVAGATGYRVYWSETPGVDPARAARIDHPAPPLDHRGLRNGARYHYVVTALNAAGESAPSSEASGVPASLFDPPWAASAPRSTRTLLYDARLGATQNGALLHSAIAALQPGERLEIGAGTWSIAARFSIDLRGSAELPIWIVARDGETPVLTRPDAAQNTINVGSNAPSRHLVLRGLEITGGDTALKLYDCANVWIDRCHVHHCAGAGIAANSAHTAALFLTRNEIHDTAGSAEGMYLGANYGQWVMRDSVIARNHVYRCYGSQGDGIEVKQGSFNNWIVENEVHDTNYPCILVYGTGGNAPNVIERNVCYRSNDNVMQVQGEAIVRNNLLIAGAIGFHSHDHQGQTRDLTFVHNTILTLGRGANLASWNGRAGMVFANNVVYSRDADAIRFAGAAGVAFAGNVARGAVIGVTSGWVNGFDLSDFADVDWTGARRDATPAAGSPAVDAGDPRWALPDDLVRRSRDARPDAGCAERG